MRMKGGWRDTGFLVTNGSNYPTTETQVRGGVGKGVPRCVSSARRAAAAFGPAPIELILVIPGFRGCANAGLPHRGLEPSPSLSKTLVLEFGKVIRIC
jgi:hypothetical protein